MDVNLFHRGSRRVGGGAGEQAIYGLGFLGVAGQADNGGRAVVLCTGVFQEQLLQLLQPPSHAPGGGQAVRQAVAVR